VRPERSELRNPIPMRPHARYQGPVYFQAYTTRSLRAYTRSQAPETDSILLVLDHRFSHGFSHGLCPRDLGLAHALAHA
jgi:hypothetical protein